MATKIMISFALLALFVTTSMQLPESAMWRAKRQTEVSEQTIDTGKIDSTKGENSGATGEPGTGVGGVPGQEIFNNFVQSITAKDSPGSTFFQQALPFFQMLANSGQPNSGDNPKGKP